MDRTLILLAIGLPWLGSLLVWLARDSREKLQHAIAVLFALGGAGAAVALLQYPGTVNVEVIGLGRVFGTLTFLPDGLAILLAVIATVIGSLAVIFSVDYMHAEHSLGRYYMMVLMFIGAMVGLVLSSNLLVMFVFWEITALCSYALISFHNDDPKAVAGGIKALLITQVGGVGLLAGALLLYAHQGTYDIPTFLANPHAMSARVLAFMGFGFLVAAAAKSAQFPFQTWLPDAMEAPTPVSALIHAATMVNAGVYLLARFYPAFEGVPGWRETVLAVGAITAIMAALMAVVADDLKRVLAHSTVSQLGYMVYAIGAGGVFASQFHLLSHAVFKALLFLCAGAVIHGVGTRDMRQMGGLGKQMPLVRATMIVGALALAGIPIVNGFWSKELVLESGLEGGPMWAYVVMVVGAGLTALYTFRFITMVFFGENRGSHGHDAGPAMKTALVPLALGTLVTWLVAGPLWQFLGSALPVEQREAETTAHILTKVATAPATLVVLAVVALGIVGWFSRRALSGVAAALSPLGTAAGRSFGFEAINRGIVNVTLGSAESLRVTQTGLLGWNVLGIILALVAVLGVLAMGGI
ncbi:MAG: NADH-quinone oxidoreductase subunit L [Bacteroidales bacterium]